MRPSKWLKAILTTFVIMIPTVSIAHDARPFYHEFGELRVYFRDWLVVCDKFGDGPCRAVYYVLGDDGETFFGTSVLRIHKDSKNADARFELYDKDAPVPSGLMFMRVDGKEVASLSPSTDMMLNVVGQDSPIVDTLTISKSRIVDPVIEAMRAGRYLSIHWPRGDAAKEIRISLRGFTAAMRFIDRQLARQ